MTMHSPLSRSAISALLLVAISSGCSSKGSDGTTTPTGSIALSLSVTSATIVQGGSTTAVGTLTRSGGFTGDVVLTVEGVPTGVTGSISNQSTAGTVTTATITILVGASVVPGTNSRWRRRGARALRSRCGSGANESSWRFSSRL